MADWPCLFLSPVIIPEISNQAMRIPLTITGEKDVESKALIDSGAGGIFIDETFARKLSLHLTQLNTPVPVFNADGTPNWRGKIKHFT